MWAGVTGGTTWCIGGVDALGRGVRVSGNVVCIAFSAPEQVAVAFGCGPRASIRPRPRRVAEGPRKKSAATAETATAPTRRPEKRAIRLSHAVNLCEPIVLRQHGSVSLEPDFRSRRARGLWQLCGADEALNLSGPTAARTVDSTRRDDARDRARLAWWVHMSRPETLELHQIAPSHGIFSGCAGVRFSCTMEALPVEQGCCRTNELHVIDSRYAALALQQLVDPCGSSVQVRRRRPQDSHRPRPLRLCTRQHTFARVRQLPGRI